MLFNWIKIWYAIFYFTNKLLSILVVCRSIHEKKWISTLIWFVLHDLQILSFSGIFLYRPLSIARKWSLILNLQIVDLYELYLQAPTQEGLWFNFKILLKVEVFCFPFNCCIDALNFSTLINDSLFLWRLYYI